MYRYSIASIYKDNRPMKDKDGNEVKDIPQNFKSVEEIREWAAVKRVYTDEVWIIQFNTVTIEIKKFTLSWWVEQFT